MSLFDYGYDESIKKQIIDENLQEFEIGRVILEHKERYLVKIDNGEVDAEITGNMRFSAEGREDFPAVGDWALLKRYDDNFAIIHKILHRKSVLSRQAVERQGELQIIASNIDYAFLVQAVDRDFNINRLERYLAICYAARVAPIIVLTKIDLVDDARLSEIVESINHRIEGVKIICIDNNMSGYSELDASLENGKTYCLLGSSGVGKSTIINNLLGRDAMKTSEISVAVNKGRHTTSHRELISLPNGGVIIDNPGMREVGIGDSYEGIGVLYDKIEALAENCKYKDCKHINEQSCAVLRALENGKLDRDLYKNYQKMIKESAFFQSNAIEKRQKDKDFGKMVKNIKKGIYKYNSKDFN
jgi:ribosome biogenesis GTPase